MNDESGGRDGGKGPDGAEWSLSCGELDERLEQHASWRAGGEGGPANLHNHELPGASFRGRDLVRADFRRARLEGADFEDANLDGARFCGADLHKASFRNASLRGADFGPDSERQYAAADLSRADLVHADLSDASLTDVRGLQARQLGGAILSNTELPSEIADFKGIDQAAEISRHARGIFLAVIGGCVFSWLTVATTTDQALLLNRATTPLPVLQTPVPIAGFYSAGALILIMLYVYFHIYLQRLWDSLSELPAIFPDGRRLDQHAYPWLLSGLAVAFVPRLLERRPLLWRLQVGLAFVAGWGLVPFTLLLLWLRHLPRHDWPGTIVLIAALVLSAWAGVAFFRRARTTLSGLDSAKILQNPGPEAMAAFLTATLAFGLSDTAYQSSQRFSLLGFHSYARIAGQELSEKPDRWRASEEDYLLTRPARLEGGNLRQLDGASAFLAMAELQGADLRDADLRDADLTWANLTAARMDGARLAETKLVTSDLTRVDLSRADMPEASLLGAYMDGTDLSHANLEEADLREAIFIAAAFDQTNFSEARFSGARFYCSADGRICNDLTKARGLTLEQLSNACAESGTKFPSGWKIRECRKLF